MSKQVTHTLIQSKEGITLDGKPLTENDVLFLLSHLANKTNDNDLHLVIDYWCMLKESGHNGFYLKQYHADTQNINESIRIGDKPKVQKQ